MSTPTGEELPGSKSKGQAPRLKLSMPSAARSANLQTMSAPGPEGVGPTHELLRRPSYSPVTPVSTNTPRQDTAPNQTKFMTEPEPIPVDLDDNSDAIALEAALSILQMQKKQAQHDLKQLKKMKVAAQDDPDSFVAALEAGKLSQAPNPVPDGDDDNEDGDPGRPKDETMTGTSSEPLGQFPNPQEVVRAPPINWAKYHIVGEPLDRLHLEQQQRPEPGQPRRDDHGRPPKHVMAAPYRPLVDPLEPETPQSNSEKRG